MHSAGFEAKKNCTSNYLILITFAQRGFRGPALIRTTLHCIELNAWNMLELAKEYETASAKYHNLWRSVHFSEREKS